MVIIVFRVVCLCHSISLDCRGLCYTTLIVKGERSTAQYSAALAGHEENTCIPEPTLSLVHLAFTSVSGWGRRTRRTKGVGIEPMTPCSCNVECTSLTMGRRGARTGLSTVDYCAPGTGVWHSLQSTLMWGFGLECIHPACCRTSDELNFSFEW